MRTPSPGQNLLGHAAQWLERATLVALGVTVGWCFLAIPSDLNGDPNDYLFIARSMLERGLAAEGLTAMRTPGYPAFVLIASGGLRSLNMVFLVQAVLYVASVRWFLLDAAEGAPAARALAKARQKLKL